MKKLGKYGFEFFSIFVAVISAFALNNWNEARKNKNAESKILMEIYNGLEKDLLDLDENYRGHQLGLRSIQYFKDLLANKPVPNDSLLLHYFSLTRDFISIQNVSGYETLKSKGLELIRNDSLRTKIVALYEYDYNSLRKLEEEYYESQFHQNYFKDINQTLSKFFVFDANGNLIGLGPTPEVEADEKRLVLSYFWKIGANRNFVMNFNRHTRTQILEVMEAIKNNNDN